MPSADRPPDRSVEDDGVHMDVWYVEEFDGEPRNLCPEEHDAVGWFHPDDPAARPLAHPMYTVLLHGRPTSR